MYYLIASCDLVIFKHKKGYCKCSIDTPMFLKYGICSIQKLQGRRKRPCNRVSNAQLFWMLLICAYFLKYGICSIQKLQGRRKRPCNRVSNAQLFWMLLICAYFLKYGICSIQKLQGRRKRPCNRVSNA